jgi:hypothetical protein
LIIGKRFTGEKALISRDHKPMSASHGSGKQNGARMPLNWNPRNLTRHHRTRTTQDAGCFEDLLRIAGRTTTEGEYERRSHDAVENAWAEYEDESPNPDAGRLYGPAKYFVDQELVVAITDLFVRDFITCFHEHFNVRRHAHPATLGSIGQRQLRYKQFLQFEEQGRLIINVKRIRGV